jgi:methyl-accepting chemotaxis protein
MKLEHLPIWKRMAVGYVVVGVLVLILSRPDEMRTATDATVNDNSQIFHVICEVDAVHQEIVRAAEKQRLATEDISRCVQENSSAADTVTNIVTGACRAASVFESAASKQQPRQRGCSES